MPRMRIPVIVALVLYFMSLLWLAFGVPYSFTSPDENANFTFARSFRADDTFAVFDGVTRELDGLVHPRSAVAVGSFIMPGSFLGLPFIAGMFGKLSGDAGMQYLTPLLLLVALCAWFDLTRRAFGGPRFAMLATVLLAVHPGLWYYAARTMMHNVGFVSFLMLAAWAAFAEPFSRGAKGDNAIHSRVVELTVAGVCVGMALFFRTSEALWVGAAVAALAWRFRASVKGILPWLMLGVGIAVPLVVSGVLNAQLYGSPFVNGYTIEDTSGAAPDEVQIALAEVPTISFTNEMLAMVFPFGIHERAILKNVWNFGLSSYPAFTVLAAAGIALSVGKEASRWRILAVVTLGLAVWLGIVYGSWSFNDNPDPAAVTLGDSHVRYWLPLFVLSSLFAARAIAAFARMAEGRDAKGVPLAVATTTAVVLLSAVTVFGGDDGLVRTREVLFESATKREAILSQTEDDAIIVVDRADKFLWPYRHVIQPLRDEENYSVLPRAAAIAPLYYFGIPFPERDMAYLNGEKLAALGLRIELVALIADEALYRIIPVE